MGKQPGLRSERTVRRIGKKAEGKLDLTYSEHGFVQWRGGQSDVGVFEVGVIVASSLSRL
jgi:hypothetical protein